MPRAANLNPATAADQTVIDAWLAKRDELISAAADGQRAKIRTELSVANIARLHHDNFNPEDIA